MTGRVYKRTSAAGAVTWSYEIYAGRDGAGKKQRETKHGFERKGAAEKALQAAMREQSDRPPASAAEYTLRHLLARWLSKHAQEKCSPKTVERYRQLTGYISDVLMDTRLADLELVALEDEANRLHKSGGKDGRALSAKTVHHIFGVIHSALKRAIRWKLLRADPASGIELPQVKHREARALDPAETERYLDFCRGHWIGPIVAFIAATGCRRGEALALAWSDVDLDNRAAMFTKSLEQTQAGLRIKPPKNNRPRPCTLPASICTTLTEHRQAQMENIKAFGSDYRADLDLVFPAPDGDYLKPDSVTATACLMAEKAGFKGCGLHSLRHSHGSQLLSMGVPLPTVSKRLGHADPSITARVYSHSFNRDEVSAAELWDKQMGDTLKGSKGVQ